MVLAPTLLIRVFEVGAELRDAAGAVCGTAGAFCEAAGVAKLVDGLAAGTGVASKECNGCCFAVDSADSARSS